MNTGAEWMKSNGIEMSPFGEEVANLLGILYTGIYHIDYTRLTKAKLTEATYAEITVSDGSGMFSTFDDNLLTKLVLLAHSENIRVGIQAATHGYLKLVFTKVTRNGFFADRHPTLKESIKKISI